MQSERPLRGRGGPGHWRHKWCGGKNRSALVTNVLHKATQSVFTERDEKEYFQDQNTFRNLLYLNKTI